MHTVTESLHHLTDWEANSDCWRQEIIEELGIELGSVAYDPRPLSRPPKCPVIL